MNTLEQLNGADLIDALALLDGIYEHSPWIVQQALQQRPFASLAHLKYALVQVVDKASVEAQLTLIRAHPELAGKAMVDKGLTAESTSEQSRAGLTHCTPEEFDQLRALNAAYNARFGFPFILAVRGPRSTGLKRHAIIAAMKRRLLAHPDQEREECLRNIHRIAELRLNDKFGHGPAAGNQVWDWQESLSEFSEPEFAAQGQLTVTYLTDAHLGAAHQIAQDMRDCGCDTVHIDAVGNVVGRYQGTDTTAKALMTGSHFDTVRNGGKYDGRLGIYVPLACIQTLHRSGNRLPFGIEVIGFSEEEGQRYQATFLASSALTGDFQNAWLEQRDANGIRMRDAMQHAGLRVEDIPGIRRNAEDYLGFVEVHIEQGPVLNRLGIPLGIVTSINASARFSGEVIGTASHAGTTPMGVRRDAAVAVAELMLYVERRATQDNGSVGTVGMLHVPAGSINVVPGKCQFSIDLRAPSDAQRDALVKDVLAEFEAICSRRGVQGQLTETMRASAAPSHPAWQARWEKALRSLGLPIHRLPSGAGHDAMKIHTLLPQAMLFVRGENGGISHNPLESTTSDDMDLAVQAFTQLLDQMAQESLDGPG
jgi:N-carbamoyl-L-amino-acid hydrolase